MVNFKETLTKLHTEFPEFDLETLFKVMECIVEETQINLNWPTGVRTLPANDITWDKSSGVTRFYNTTISGQP